MERCALWGAGVKRSRRRSAFCLQRDLDGAGRPLGGHGGHQAHQGLLQAAFCPAIARQQLDANDLPLGVDGEANADRLADVRGGQARRPLRRQRRANRRNQGSGRTNRRRLVGERSAHTSTRRVPAIAHPGGDSAWGHAGTAFASQAGVACILGGSMNTQSWVTLIACVGELAVVLLVALRASGSRAGHAAPAAQRRPGGMELRAARLPSLGSARVAPARHDAVAAGDRDRVSLHAQVPRDARASCAGRCAAVYLYFGLIAADRRRAACCRRPVRSWRCRGTWSWCWLAGLLPLSCHHGHGAHHPHPPRHQRRGAEPHLAAAGGGGGDLAARLQRGVGRPGLRRAPASAASGSFRSIRS